MYFQSTQGFSRKESIFVLTSHSQSLITHRALRVTIIIILPNKSFEWTTAQLDIDEFPEFE